MPTPITLVLRSNANLLFYANLPNTCSEPNTNLLFYANPLNTCSESNANLLFYANPLNTHSEVQREPTILREPPKYLF